MSLKGKIGLRENPYSRIFYVGLVLCYPCLINLGFMKAVIAQDQVIYLFL